MAMQDTTDELKEDNVSQTVRILQPGKYGHKTISHCAFYVKVINNTCIPLQYAHMVSLNVALYPGPLNRRKKGLVQG